MGGRFHLGPLGTQRVGKSARWKVVYQRKIDRWPVEEACRNEADAYQRASDLVKAWPISVQVHRRPTKSQVEKLGWKPDPYGFVHMDTVDPAGES